MATEWQEVTIGDLCDAGTTVVQTGPFGSQLHADEYLPQGVPVVPTEAIRNRQIDWSVLPRISKEKAKTLSRHLLQVGDILFARRGIQATGHIGYIRQAERGMICGTGAILLRVKKPHELDSEFLSHVLADPRSIEWFKFHAVGATMPNLNDGIIRSFRFSLPPIEDQRKIAAMLSALDDRIELYRKLCGTLEELARAIFKSWFVDFDPVRAKAEGREPEGMEADTTALFPSTFEDSELGEIPSGWKTYPVGDLATVMGGSTPSTKEPECWDGGEYAWATPKDLSSLSMPILLSTAKKITSQGLARISSGLLDPGTVLLSSRAPIGYLAIAEIPTAINQGFIAMKAKDGVSNLFLLFWTKASHEAIVSRANGSTFLEISKSAFRPMPVIVPSPGIMASFDSVARPLYEAMVNNEKQSRTLVDLRDTLLPRLISGKLRVPEAEAMLMGGCREV